MQVIATLEASKRTIRVIAYVLEIRVVFIKLKGLFPEQLCLFSVPDIPEGVLVNIAEEMRVAFKQG